jgi:hypothetical protein
VDTFSGNLFVFNNGPDRTEIFLLSIADAAVDALIVVYTINTAAFDDGCLRTNSIPDASETLDTFLPDAVFHVV